MELISPTFENIMMEELKPRRRTLSETNDIFPEKKTTPKKFPNSPKSNSTFSYNDFSYKVKKNLLKPILDTLWTFRWSFMC
jgi:hypothetical protein